MKTWISAVIGAAVAIAGATLLTSCGGCNRAETIAIRESMDRSTATMRSEHLDWSEKLAANPAKPPVNLENLTAEQREFWLQQRRNNHSAYEALVKESQEADKSAKWNPFAGP